MKKKFIILTVLIASSIFFMFFKKKEEQEILFNDQELSIYINGVLAESIPSKTDNVIFDEQASNCNHGATIRWDYEDWGPIVINGTTTKTKCNLRFKTGYKESLLNGTDPVLKDELIPVTIENDGTVKKADLSEEWYSYENQRWANAVILKDESTKNNYTEKDVIPEEAIESYFVWIPRYRYKIFNEGNYEGLTGIMVDNKLEDKSKIIEVVFENHTTPISNGSKVNEWLTHPAFTSFNSNGMWVGKFETSKSNDKEDNSINPSGVEIKPNAVSWRNIQVANAFYTSYNYKRNLESHMMKNMEWGAVAYLQHSNYGSHTSVRINNSAKHLTGHSSKKDPTCGFTDTNIECNYYCNDGTCDEPYNTEVGYLASTTGNITGIYDMSGGTWEYVMGVLTDENGILFSGRKDTENSGFNGVLENKEIFSSGKEYPSTKYYDKYEYTEIETSFKIGHLGDATKEMGPFGQPIYDNITGTSTGSGKKNLKATNSWHGDYTVFIASTYPYFVRGGDHRDGTQAGIFSSHHNHGDALSYASFRLVLVPDKNS